MENNFFNTSDPLNLLQTTELFNPKLNNPVYRHKYNTDSSFREEELRKLREEKKAKDRKFLESLRKSSLEEQKKFEQVKGEKYLEKLTSPQVPTLGNLEALAAQEAVYARDPETNKLLFPTLATQATMQALRQKSKLEEEFLSLYEDINNLVKVAQTHDEKDFSPFKKAVYNRAISTGQVSDLQNFEERWEDMDGVNKTISVLNTLGNKYLKGLDLEKFKNLDPLSQFEMLCAFTIFDSRYESLSTKLKKETELAGKEASEGWLSTIGLGQQWRNYTEYTTNRFMYGLVNNRANPLATLGAGLNAGVGHVGNLIGTLGDSIASWVYNRAHGGNEKEAIDALIRERANNYIEKQSQDRYEYWMTTHTLEEKHSLAEEVRRISRDATFGSNYYRLHEGDSYTKNVDEAQLIKEYFKMRTRAETFGEENASNSIKEFWQDTVAGNQSTLDKTIATGALLMDTFAADIASFGALMINFALMPVDTHGSINPKDWTVDGEGYSDALVKRNWLLKWATGLLETGCWIMNELEKYKQLGLSKDQLYRTVEQQNQFMSVNDIGDIIGLYGFTAASSFMSMGGTGVIRGLASAVGRNAMKLGIKGTVARSLLHTEGKTILKNALKTGATEMEITKALEVASELASKTLYRGNLTISALLGTGEGALEAKNTYDQFIKDNKARIDQLYEQRMNVLNNATKEQLRQYMTNKGYEGNFVRIGGDSNAYIKDFTEELYAQAKAEIQQRILDEYSDNLNRMEDDAADAAFANLLSNSAINGALHVFGKELSMSKDARSAIRLFRGEKKLTDFVSIEKGVDGKWHATVNKAIEANKNNSWWGDAKNAMKVNGKWNKAKALYGATKESTFGKIITNAGAEAVEEFLQGVSDAASRAAFENDLNQYMATVYDKDARQQFMTDWGGIVEAGLNEITSNALNTDNIKAGLMGFFSTMAGGASIAAFILRTHGFGVEQKNAKGFWENTKAYSKWALSNLGGFYDSAIRLALEENNNEYATAQRLLESTERWLLNDKNQEILTHMGGAIGFSNLMQQSFLAGDDFMAKNHHLGMAVENSLMLKALEGTAMRQEYLKALAYRMSLGDIVNNEEKVGLFFDGKGSLRTSNLIQDAEGSNVDPLTSWIKEAALSMQSLISQFKNTNSLNFTSGMSDLEIIQKVVKNAKEMIELDNRVAKAQQLLAKVFHNQEVDPLVQSAYIYSMIAQEDARNRRTTLTLELSDAVDVSKQPNLDEEDKKALTSQSDQRLDLVGINLAIEYGSIDNALKKRKELLSRENQLDTDAQSMKTKKEREEAATLKTAVHKQLVRLEAKLKLAGIEILNQKTTPIENEAIPTEGNTSPNIITLGEDTHLEETSTYPLISVADLVNMSPALIFELLSNRNRFSKAQNKIIDLFINITRKGLAEQRQDPSLTNDEVIADYKDQYRLIEKSKTYDDLLTEYLNHPKFLSNRAGELQYEDRTRTLRYIYKDELQLKEGETPLDMRDRISAKIDDLRNKGKHLDAQILLKLVSENKEIVLLQQTFSSIDLMAASLAILSPEEARTDLFTKVYTALRAIASASSRSLDAIKELFDHNDIDSISDLLRRTFANGDSILNKYLAQVGLEQVVDINKEDFSSLILATKNYLTKYYNLKASSQKQGAPHNIQGSALPSSYQDPASLHKGPAVPAGLVNTDGSEPRTLKIISPGELDVNTPIFKFLTSHGADNAVKNLTAKQQVHFMVTNEGGLGAQVFAVVKLDNSVRFNPNIHFDINGEKYQVIGTIDNTQSRKLTINAASTYASLTGTSKAALLKEGELDLYTDFGKIDLPKSVGEVNLEDAKPIKDLLNGEDTKETSQAITNWISELMDKGREVSGEKDKEGNDKKPWLKDLNGYPVSINTVYFYDITLPNGKTIKEVLLDDSISIKDKVALLKLNSAFKLYFQSWREIGSFYNSFYAQGDSEKVDKNLYLHLIGNFIYLGHLYGKESEKENSIFPETDGEGSLHLTVLQHSGPGTIEFELPMASDSTALKEEKALNALLQIMQNSEESNDESILTFARPLISFEIIDATQEPKSNDLKLKEIEILKGWIEAGILVGFLPSSVSRNMIIRNPYTKASNSTKPVGGTSNGAPNMNPGNPGNMPGGTKDLNSGLMLEGNPLTASEKLEELLSEAAKRAKSIVNRIIARGKLIVLGSNHTYTDTLSNLQAALSATLGEVAFVGGKAKGWLGKENEKTISTAFGNIIDNLFRAALEILNSSTTTIDEETLYLKILQDPAFKGKNAIPCHSKRQIKQVLKSVIAFKQLCYLRGWHIVSKDIKVWSQAPVLKGGSIVGTIPVAGALDILVYDDEGIFHIIDMKTKNMDSTFESNLEDSKEDWTVLISTYLAMLLLMYPEMQFGENYVMPIGVKYNRQQGTPIVEEDNMTVQGQMAILEPQMLPTIKDIKDPVLDDYLYPIETLPFKGYDYDKLAPEVQQKMTTTLSTSNNNPLKEVQQPVASPVNTKAPTPSPASEETIVPSMAASMGSINLDAFASTRTQRLSRFTEFVNNHVANFVRPKLNIISKVAVKAKEIFTHTGYVDRLVRQDLANTFFDGDIEKFERICGKDITISNLPLMISAVRNYYTYYSNNRAWYVKNISDRHKVAKLVHLLLNRQITMLLLEEELTKINVETQNIPELVEYITTENPEEVAKSILSKLEKSKLHTQENYDLKLTELTTFMNSLDAKLDFLNSEVALQMLTNRISSIRESILSNNVDLMNYSKGGALEDLLAGKQGNYGAQKLLRGIATRSKNPKFRHLAAKLLNELKHKNFTINVTLDNGEITDIEGESRCKNIIVHKASLSSYERLERVLLHEMLHSVVLTTPEVRELLLEYLDNTINQLIKTTNMSREEIIKQHYGLTSVDEFISEYFTNLAFLESLKGVSDVTENFNSIYDRITHTIKSYFTGNNSIYDEVSPIMEHLIGTHNTESINKETIRDTSSLIKTTFNRLENYLQQIISRKGFTAKEFDALPALLQKVLVKCCL